VVIGLVSQVIVNPPGYPEYYEPYRLLIGPTAGVLPDGAVWFHGGTFLDNQLKDYGIWHGVFTVGIGGVAEVQLSMSRLLSNLPSYPWTQINEVSSAMKLSVVRLQHVMLAVHLQVSPGVVNEVPDTIVLFAPHPVYYGFVRIYRTRTAYLTVPLTVRFGRLSVSAGAGMVQFGTRMEMRDLPPLSGCEAGVLCDSLKAWLSTEPFRSTKDESVLTAYTGYVGGAYGWRERTDLLFEVNLHPRFLYRGMFKRTGITGYGRYSPRNRIPRDTAVAVIRTFAGVRHSFSRNFIVDAGIVLPYDTGLPPGDRLNLLSATLYLNLHVILSLKDLEF